MFKYDPRNLSNRKELENLLENVAPFETIKTGTVAPATVVVPDGVGQLYVDTTGRIAYISVGLTNADWLRISNV